MSLKVNTGRFLAEVFKVVYLGGEEVPPDKQLGTIKVRNHRYHHYIYNVDKADTSKSSIKHGEELTLTGPTLAPISCPSGYLVIEADLFCDAFKSSIRIDWAPVPGDECKFFERRIKSKKGPGEIIIFLGMFFYATEALLDVSLLTKDSSDVSVVGGVVAAYTSNSVKPEHSSSLFSEKIGCNIKVQSGESIPLSKSIIVVPLRCKFFLSINLSCDDETIAGTLKFEAALNGTFHKSLIGTKCEVKAKVIWNAEHECVGALNDRCVYSDEESDEDWLSQDGED